MQTLNDRYHGDTFFINGTYKVNGVPTPIDNTTDIKLNIQTVCGIFPLEIVKYPNQNSNPGKFQAGALITVDWGTGRALLQGRIGKDVNTLLTDLNRADIHTNYAEFVIKESI